MAEWQYAKLLGRAEILRELRDEAERLPRTPVKVRKWIEAKLFVVEMNLEAERRDSMQRQKIWEWERENRKARNEAAGGQGQQAQGTGQQGQEGQGCPAGGAARHRRQHPQEEEDQAP